MNVQDTVDSILMASDDAYMAIQDEVAANAWQYQPKDWALLTEASRARYEFNRDGLKH